MLTRDEKDALDAIRAQLDAQQRAAFDGMSEEEKKEFLADALEEAQRQVDNLPEEEQRALMNEVRSSSPHPSASWAKTKNQFRRLQDMPFGEFFMEYGGKGILSTVFFWLFLKATRTRKGCGCLAVVAAIVVSVVFFLLQPGSPERPQPQRAVPSADEGPRTGASAEVQAESRPEARREAEQAKTEIETVNKKLRAGGKRKAGETKIVTLPGGAKMEMVWCPPGAFLMGSPENEAGRNGCETQHPVTLSQGFWMAKTEVTQAQWESVMGTGVRRQRDKADTPLALHGEGDAYPMYYVSWNEAREFCRKAGLQLPTEAQWEYACRADEPGAHAGNGKLDDMGWYTSDSGGEAHPVGTKRPNAWGLHDMHGNVWEWCEDRYGNFARGAVADPQGPDEGENRVIRGGGWIFGAGECRSASRGDGRSFYLGFRPVTVRP